MKRNINNKTSKKPAAKKTAKAKPTAPAVETPTTKPTAPAPETTSKGIEKWRALTPADVIKMVGTKVPPSFEGITDRELLEFFNGQVSPSKRMTAFKDRESAEIAVADLLLAFRAKDKKGTALEGSTAKAPKARGENFGRGRTSSHAGKFISRKGEHVKTNPRKEGTHGWKSFELIPSKGSISYESYIEKGGRSNDLAWDLERGYVEVKASK